MDRQALSITESRSEKLYLLDRRALLTDADHGLRAVSGVELDPDLHALAHDAGGLARRPGPQLSHSVD
jgi:hypothetical protein